MKTNHVVFLLFLLSFFNLFSCDAKQSDSQHRETVTDGLREESDKPAKEITISGIDVSHHQGEVDWALVKRDEIHFAFMKATEGVTWVDPKFQQNWKAAKEADIIRGAYHFYRPERDAISQAENFINTVVLESGDLPPVLDVELKYNVSKRDIRQDVLIWLKYVEAAYNRKPILYTDSSFVNLELTDEFTRYPLWIAEYSDSVRGSLAGWEKWTFWQYTNSGKVKGVSGPVDRNIFRGTLTEWGELVSGE